MFKQIWENDQISIRIDKVDKYTTIETNSGGLIPTYNTIYLQLHELEELIEALKLASENLNNQL